MVAKGFMAAAAIIICCATTLQGNDQETKCSGGDCPTACSDKEKCSAETTACADGQCDDKEECCEKEQVSLEKCSKGKCSKEQASIDKCSTEKCAKSKCSAGACDKQTCSTDKCSTEKCTAAKTGGEKCAFTTTLGGLCDPLRCALEPTPVSIGVTVETCSKSECNASSCAGVTCPVAACASQVCDALKCAVESCTTASTDDCPQKTVCATGACGTTQCASLQCSNQDCPAGECIGGVCAVEGTSGLRCGLNASLNAAGGEVVLSMGKWFPGTSVAEKCSAETECSKTTCSTEKTATGKCAGKACATSACSKTRQAVRLANRDRAIQEEMLATKLTEIEKLQREVEMLRRLVGSTDDAAVETAGQSAYETALLAAAIKPKFVTVVYPVPDLQVWTVRPDGVEFDADLLITHIKSTVDPQSWRGGVCADPKRAEHADGAIRPFERNGSLVICQTEENHKQITHLLTKMRADGQAKNAAREERELRDGRVTPASAEESVETESKCSKGECSKPKGACSESKCTGAECSKSQVSLDSAPADQCAGDCQGQCDGECPEAASCPCIGGACTR